MVTLAKTCDEIAHPRLPVQDRYGISYCYNCIIEAFQAKGYNLACRMLRDWALAEDVLQESFVSGYRAFSQFRGDNLNAWMMRIIANTCRDFLRSRRARPIISLDPLPTADDDPTPSAVDLPSREESPEDYAEREELRRAIVSGLDPSAGGASPDCGPGGRPGPQLRGGSPSNELLHRHGQVPHQPGPG